jgi:molecular chaperone DnaK
MSEAERAEVEGEPNEGFTLLGNREVEVPDGPAGQPVEATYKYTQDGTIDIRLHFPRTGEEVEFQTRAEVDEASIEVSREKVDQVWQDSEYLDDVEALMDAAERELEEGGLSAEKEKEVKRLLTDLKNALAVEEESDIRRLEEELTDLLFELDL